VLPSLSPQEEQAARLALSKLSSGAGVITSRAVGLATPHGVTGSDSVVVGSGSSTIAGSHHPKLLSGADSVVAGSAVALHAAETMPGGKGSGFRLTTDTIAQVGPTAAGIRAEVHPSPATGVTMPDQTKINVSGLSPPHLTKHTGHG
jgi:hypothetical protein